MAGTVVAARNEGGSAVARPLREIQTLIQEKMKEAEEAAAPYWAEVGDLLVEARGQFNTVSAFYGWASTHFGFSQTQTRRYENSAKYVAPQNRHGGTSLSDALRSAGKSPRGHHGLGAREWIRPIDEIVERARREAERIREQELTRQQEREAERQLALRLIDIGYKVLAKELHPDKGGSKETMSRLHTVRDRLKGCS